LAKEVVLAGTQSYMTYVFLRKTSVATGAGQAGITAGQTSASYIRLGASGPVAIPMVAGTVGTYGGSATQGAIGEIKTAAVPNSTGLYEFHVPNNAFASGARTVIVFLSDAGNSDSWEPIQLQFQMLADDPSTRLLDVNTATYTVASSIGKMVVDRVDTNINSRLAPAGTLNTVTNLTNAPSITLSQTQLNQIADTVLMRDWLVIPLTPAPPQRSLWNAARFLRNKWSTTAVAGNVLVYDETDSSEVWRAALTTDAAAIPITSSDPTT